MKRKDIKKIIIEHFFKNPSSKLRVRNIEKELDLPLPSIIRYCKELEKEGILKKVHTGNVTFYTADNRNDNYLVEKRFFNIKSLYASGLLEFFRNQLSNPVIIVFGSYALGEDAENSDIDLYIETPSKKKISLEKYEKILKRKIHLMSFESMKKVRNKDLANNILNGIVLNGFVEAVS